MKLRNITRGKTIAQHLVLIIFSLIALSLSVPAYASPPALNTVTFYENASATDSVSTYQTGSSSQGLILFSNLQPSFSNSGHAFAGWNTSANGTGTSYLDGANYSFNSSLQLYAQWSNVQAANTVTFYENASATDSVSTYQTGSSIHTLTLFSNLSPAFSNQGHRFVNWNTAADGSGTSFNDGGSYSFNANLQLYAQWQAATPATANFLDNGGTGSVSSIVDPAGSTIQIPFSTTLSYPGYAFSDWNTAANGSGTSYAAGTSTVLSVNETFYAQWTPLQFVVTFAPDGGTVNPATIYFVVGGAPITLPSPSFQNESFNGWFSQPSGGVLVGLAGSTYTPTQALALFAQWAQAPTVQISVSANGGSGSSTALSGVVGSIVTLPTSSNLLRPGFTLTSWNTTANGSGIRYAPGQSVTLSTSLTLYAQWKKTPTSILYGAVGFFTSKSVTLSARLKTQVRHLAVAIRSKKYARVTLYGYTAATGVASLNRTLSLARARNVANFLRRELSAMKIRGVAISAAGEGAVAGKTAPQYSRVEVFVS
ncbi:MAG: InlB B-repeat-containing protein [Acidimicrobiales bacterium]